MGREERSPVDLREMVRTIWARKWTVLGITALTGAVTLGLGLLQKNVYQASAVLKPVEERESGGMNQIGGVLSGFGVDFGGPSDIQSLAVLFRSQELAVRVFGSDNLFLAVYPTWKKEQDGGLLPKNPFEGAKRGDGPSEWDYIRAAQKHLTVQPEIKKKVITVSFDSTSPPLAAKVVRSFMDEAKNLMQEQALSRAVKNIAFLENTIRNTHDAMAKDSLFSLYNREIEKEMLARNKEHFGFVVVDPPRVPDRKVGPHRFRRAVFASFAVFFLTLFYFLLFKEGGGKPG